jgi:diguanylate cyclase (GGDEF)-like protein
VLIAFPTVLLVRRFLVFPVLEAQSRVDAKTGLLNVSTWEREAEAELSRSARTGTSLALAVADIDHFKSVNDTHGHLVGDKVLRAVADALTGQLRAYDRAGRFGGEEFVLLLPQTGEEDARSIAERLRRHVANMAVPIDDSDNARCVRLTISIGVSSTNGARCELTDLLAAADAALYYAKRSGRNMTHVVPAAPMINENGQVVDRRDAIAGLRQADPAGASLCPAMLLYVFTRVHRECAVPQPPAYGPPDTRRLARVPHRAVVQRPALRRTREPSRSRGVTPALPSAFRLQCTTPPTVVPLRPAVALSAHQRRSARTALSTSRSRAARLS